MAKFLIIRFSSIGDIVLTTPVFRCLKKQLTDAEIHFVTKSNYKVVTASNPYIDRFFYLDENLESIINELKNEKYDYIIDLHHNLRSKKIKSALRVKSFSVNKLNLEKFLLTNLNINLIPPNHITTRSLDTVASLGVKDDGAGLDYFIPQEDIVPQTDIPTSHAAGFLALVIGATYKTKKLPLQKLQELCKKITHPVILLGGKEDVENAKLIAAVDPVKIYNACGKYNLNESADLIRRSKLVVSHDTGLMHIAAALQKPIISVWGNTTPVFGMYPFYGFQSKQQFDSFEIKKLRCRPCSKIGYNHCPMEHFKCMENLSMDALLELIYSRLSGIK